MRKEYQTPNVEVESFKIEDVVTVSGGNNGNDTPEQEI